MLVKFIYVLNLCACCFVGFSVAQSKVNAKCAKNIDLIRKIKAPRPIYKRVERATKDPSDFSAIWALLAEEEKNGNKHEFGITVFGGEEAKQDEFPHMAALGYGSENYSWKCGGTLISDKYVVTAGHCAHDRELGPITMIRLGSVKILTPNKNVQDIPVKNIIVHPEYEPPSRYNDIALVELQRQAQYSKSVLPACIYTRVNLDTFIVKKTPVTAVGWGSTSFSGDITNNLMKVDMGIRSHGECQKAYPSDSKLEYGIRENTQFCANGTKDDDIKDTCKGDSGGPLQIKYEDFFVILGVTSFGKICGITTTPGVYTRIASYVPWIESIIWNE